MPRLAISFTLCLIFAVFFANAQKKINVEKKIGNKIINIQFHYTYQLPGADMANVFGAMHNVGFGALFKTKKNWLLSFDGSYQFGGEVKDDPKTGHVLANLTNSSNYVLNSSGVPASYSVGERGMSVFLKGGKVFPVIPRNFNSGIAIMLGGGYISHKINIGTSKNDVPTLTDELKKGYDRLSSGWAGTEFIGFYYQSRNRRINFFAGFDFIQAITVNHRGFNYDQMAYDTGNHLDLFYGFRVGWMIPIYLSSKSEDEFIFR